MTEKINEVVCVARAALDYIDALPKDVVASLPAMPGFDRDWAENVLAAGVPDDVLEEAAPIDRRYMLDMSDIKTLEVDVQRVKTAIDALRFLAEKERPIYGNSPFNTEHLYDIAGSLSRMLERHRTIAKEVLKP